MANEYSIEQLAKVDQNGFTAALFPQIKDAYCRKMKEIYGNDIDLSTASADAQFIMMESLVINNIYRLMESVASSLVPGSASGKFLDIIASFSGAQRQQPTYSTAQLYIWNMGSPVNPDQITCVDKAGNTWVWVNPLDLTGSPKITIPTTNTSDNTADDYYQPSGPYEFRCTNVGPINAVAITRTIDHHTTWKDIYDIAPYNRGGDIYQTIDVNNLAVYQNTPAFVGSDLESDASLRARRVYYFGESGATVLNSLQANLLAIDGVDDVFVYSNNTPDAYPFNDDCVVDPHNVYICIWLNPAIDLNDVLKETIGINIYNQLTPGVFAQYHSDYTPSDPPVETVLPGGLQETYQAAVYSTGPNSVAPVYVYYKLCVAKKPSIKLEYTLKNGTQMLSQSQKEAIKTILVSYFNNLKIGESVIPSDVIGSVGSVDFKTQPYGLPSYEVTTVNYYDATDGVEDYVPMTESKSLPLTRFGYAPSDITFDDENHFIYLNDGTEPFGDIEV